MRAVASETPAWPSELSLSERCLLPDVSGPSNGFKGTVWKPADWPASKGKPGTQLLALRVAPAEKSFPVTRHESALVAGFVLGLRPQVWHC